jgi:predicted heme/steroid binding protein
MTHTQAQREFLALRPFTGPNVYAEYTGGRYVVYSYGDHFPMYVLVDGTWYANRDSYSKTTARHKGRYHPWRTGADCKSIVGLDTQQMRALAGWGRLPERETA